MPQELELPRSTVGRLRPEGMPTHERRRWRGGLYLAVWTLIGVLFVGPSLVRLAAEGHPAPWAEVASNLLGWYIWGALFPLIWWWTRRGSPRRHWPLWLLGNIALGLGVALLYVALDVVQRALLFEGGPKDGLFERWRSQLGTGIWFYLLVYFAIVAVIHALAFYEKFRSQELVASRLEGQLAQANLQMLKMQLHPHFLFNTLNAISALMHRDVEAADRMITQLSELLRIALEKDDRHQVRLKTELDFLDRYLRIEQIRFRDRLKVEIDVAPECLTAQVPRLILQPLVENSIRHGIAMRSAAGRLRIRARRRVAGEPGPQDGYLVMTVADDGPGIAPNRALRPGVGLSNSQARLEQLYGDDYKLRLINGDGNGFEVHVEIPFEHDRRLLSGGEDPLR